MKHVLVTGGAGFIGSHVVDELLERKYSVTVFDNLASGKKEYINKKATFIKGDVSQKSQVEKLLSGSSFDVILHIAGQPSIVNSFTNPELDFGTNFIGSVNMIMGAVKHNIDRFLYASSMTVYGNPIRLPIREEDACVPINYYGIAKYAAERFIHTTASRVDLESPLNVTSFRMFNVYGPRQSLTNPYQGVLAIFMGNVLRNEPITIYGDGKQARDFVYVKDVARMWVDAIENKKSFGKVFNIGFGRQTGMLDLAKTVIHACGKNSKTYPILFKSTRSGDQRFVEADITEAKKYLRFSPTTSLENGIKKTLDWAQKYAK
ncbi:MAG TPA: SDR family NAD(P)-dependent oxidoreductase [Candidatus Eisenbacteria bacterium]|nr:SDR family NAD(P)-dependent oxidoreductase [Candidatus Eisenbacteria bacterium]